MTKPVASADSDFYLPADRFFASSQPVALTYDDVSLATLYSEILPKDANLATSLSDSLGLQIPIISSDMDTVTESRMAIAMALNGGLGLIHYNLPAKDQLREVARVKHHIHGLIQDPMTVRPDQLVGDVLGLIEQRRFDFRTFPVVDQGKLVGLLPGNLVKERYKTKRIADIMTPRKDLHTVPHKRMKSDPIKEADKFFSENVGIHKILVVDEKDHLKGLVTISDVERITAEAKSRPSRPSASPPANSTATACWNMSARWSTNPSTASPSPPRMASPPASATWSS
jgi:IMP dehydrogenase